MSYFAKILRFGIITATVLQSALAAANPIKIGIGIDAAFAPFFIAQQRGAFKRAGLDVDLVRFTQGGESLDAAVAGQVQVVASAEMTTMIRLPRADLRPLVIYEESGNYIKLVARAGINSVQQIKKFGVVKGSSSEYATFKTLQKFGLDRQSVQLLPTAPPELPALMTRGDIDAFFAWEPWPAIGLKQGGKVLQTSGDVGYTFAMWLTVSGAWLDANRDAAKKLIEVIAETNRQIIADPVKASEDLQAQTKLSAADTVAFLRDTKWRVRNFTAADIESYDQVADFLASQKVTPVKVDVRKSLQQGFYKE